MTEKGCDGSEKRTEIEVWLPAWLARAADEKGIDLSEVLEEALKKIILAQSGE